MKLYLFYSIAKIFHFPSGAKKMFGFVLALCFSLVFMAVTQAAEDPFAAIQEHISTVSAEIQKSGVNQGCYNQYGKDIYPFYKTLVNTPKQDDIHAKEKELSTRFENQSKAFDDHIFETIVRTGQHSGLGCSLQGKQYLEWELQQIMIEKNKLSQKTLASPELYKQYGKEYDPQSKESHIFTETQNTWETLKEKFKALSSAIASLKSNPLSGFSLSTSEQSQISASAREKAIAYRDEFWGNVTDTLFAPLYEERSSILDTLKGLPDKKSKFMTVWAGRYEEVFTAENTEKVNTKTDQYISESTSSSMLLTQIVQKKQQQASDVQDYKSEVDLVAEQREEPERFASPNTQAVINALSPAQESIRTTGLHLKTTGESLEQRNAAQKRE